MLHLFSDWLRRDEREDAELRGKSVLGSDWSRLRESCEAASPAIMSLDDTRTDVNNNLS